MWVVRSFCLSVTMNESRSETQKLLSDQKQIESCVLSSIYYVAQRKGHDLTIDWKSHWFWTLGLDYLR